MRTMIVLAVVLATGCGAKRGASSATVSRAHYAPVRDPGRARAMDAYDDPRTLPPEHQPKWDAPPEQATPTSDSNLPPGLSHRVENGVHVFITRERPYCFGMQTVTLCAQTEPRCLSLAVKLRQPEVKCGPADWTVCFISTHIMSGSRDAFCFDTMSVCEQHRFDFATDRDHSATSPKCFVIRYEG